MKKCSVKGCAAEHLARGFCNPHYLQLRRKGKLPPIQMSTEGVRCKVEWCEEPVRCKGLCSRHYNYLRRTGKTHKEINVKVSLCKVEGCTRQSRSLELCVMHYNRYRRTKSTDRHTMVAGLECAVPYCEGVSRSKGLCEKHYARKVRGTLTDEVLQNGEKALADKLEDLEDLIQFGVTDLDELWTRAGFTNKEQMLRSAPKELTERIKLYADSGIR